MFAVLCAASIALIAFFAQWWFQPDHVPTSLNGPDGEAENTILFILAAYVVWHPILMNVFSWAIAYQIQDPNFRPAKPGLRVALITTFVPGSETIELLEKTLPAMIAAEYPHDTWLLDEGNVDEVKMLCQKLGVNHFSRHGIDKYNTPSGKFGRKTKGGNHNAWYDQHGDGYDIVGQMDTDFAPKPNYLTRTLGYFDDPQIAFVGTPQIYGNTNESLVAKGAAEQAFKFYGPILRGFSGLGSAIMIGANHIVRVEALKQIDHYSGHITEDLITGMRLHAKKWTSVYVPELLAIGEGPATWPAYFNQQMRWAYGCFDILFRHSPGLLTKMIARRAWYYFFTQQHYFSGLAMMLGLLGMGLYAIFGIASVSMSWAAFVYYYFPVLIICELMSLWMQRYNIRPKEERGLLLAGRLTSLASWPIFFLALVGVVTGRRLTYKVTPKGNYQPDSFAAVLGVFVPHFVIAAYCLLCLILAIARHHDNPVMTFWLIVSALLMLALPFVEPLARFLRVSRG